jgi:pimeloyl-ACP methyl ester carboxylesterase
VTARRPARVVVTTAASDGPAWPRANRIADAFRSHGFTAVVVDHRGDDPAAVATQIAATADAGIRAGDDIVVVGEGDAAAAALAAVAERPGVVRGAVALGGHPERVAAMLPAIHVPTLLIVAGSDSTERRIDRELVYSLAGPRRVLAVPGARTGFVETDTLDQASRLAATWLHDHVPPR